MNYFSIKTLYNTNTHSKNIKIYFLVILLISHVLIFSKGLRPKDNQQLNYIHVLFEWEQIPYADSYQLKIINLENDSTKIIDSIFSTNHVEKNFISFGKSYQWQFRGSYNLEHWNKSKWKGPYFFSTSSGKLGNIEVENYIDSLIQPGLTFFGGPNPTRHSIIIDKYGKEIWNDSNKKFKINYIDEFGALYGNSDFNFPNNKACKINYDLDILWSSNELVDNHDLKETDRNTFFLMRHVYSLGPVPSDNYYTQSFQNLGFLADDSTKEFPYYGQEIVEMDSNNQVLWNWDPFEHFSVYDYDNHGHTWGKGYQDLEYDWTHSNALYFDKNENALYLSSRHLSRITKISYPSGEIIYNISLPSDYIKSGDLFIGNDMLFNFQHHIEITDQNSFTLFDNGNISNIIFNHGERISRAIEYEVISDSIINILWEYALPPNLFGHAGGSVKVLKNNNRLIYTRGNGLNTQEPSILEVSYDKEIIWKMTGSSSYAWYRAFRVPSIHPDRYSVIIDNLSTCPQPDSTIQNSKCILFDNDHPQLKIKILNDSDYSQAYIIKLSDSKGWLNFTLDTLFIEKNSFKYTTHNPNINPLDTESILSLVIFPEHHKHNKKTNHIRLSYNSDKFSNIARIINIRHNYPNPFNSSTILKYDLYKKSKVEIIIYNSIGSIIRNLFRDTQISGLKSIKWDANDNLGRKVAAGVYFYRIQAGEFTATKKMVLLK